MDDTRKELVTFLKSLHESIENNTITDIQLQRVGEFFMSYNFKESLYKNDPDEKEMIKYLSLGWYIHNIIKK